MLILILIQELISMCLLSTTGNCQLRRSDRSPSPLFDIRPHKSRNCRGSHNAAWRRSDLSLWQSSGTIVRIYYL